MKLVGVITFLSFFANLLTPLTNISNASSIASCITASPSYAGGFQAHGAFFEVEFFNNCQGVDVGSVHVTLNAGGSSNSQSLYMTYGSQQVMFDTFYVPRGTWGVSVTISVDKDISQNSINFGSFYDSGPSSSTVVVPSGGKQVCINAPGGQPQCQEAPNFYWSDCSSNANGMLYSELKGNWVKVWAIKGQKSSHCASKYPYLIEVKGATKQTSGTANLKVIFGNSNNFVGYTQPLILIVR